MEMMNIVRHEVGMMMVRRVFPALASSTFIAAAFAALVLKWPATRIVGSVLFFLLSGTLMIYLAGRSDRLLIKKYLTAIAEEQGKVILVCAKFKAEWVDRLKMCDRDPLQVYEHLQQGHIDELMARHEQSAGERTLDIALSRSVRDFRHKVDLLHFAKKKGLVLSKEEVDGLRAMIRCAIDDNDAWATRSQATLEEARRCLTKLS